MWIFLIIVQKPPIPVMTTSYVQLICAKAFWVWVISKEERSRIFSWMRLIFAIALRNCVLSPYRQPVLPPWRHGITHCGGSACASMTVRIRVTLHRVVSTPQQFAQQFPGRNDCTRRNIILFGSVFPVGCGAHQCLRCLRFAFRMGNPCGNC